VKRALARGTAQRVVVIDWDVHHGNGTQEAFYDDDRVLMVSLHQEGLYPSDSGTLDEVGIGRGEGYTVNVPLPAGTGDAGYAAAVERVVLPIARRFRPDLVVVSSGLDASRSDPLARMVVTADGFRSMTRSAMALAGECAGGRLALVHEGGYSQAYAPLCGLAIFEELTGVRTEIGRLAMNDAIRRLRPTREVGLDAERAIAETLAVYGRYWEIAAAASPAAR